MSLPDLFTVTARDFNQNGQVDQYLIEPELMADFCTDPSKAVIWVSITNQYGTPVRSIGSTEQFKALYPQLFP